jgi:hypothetical protein
MKFQAFARFNGGFRFSSRAPHGRRIYEALKAAQGDTWDESFEGRQSARLFAAAMALAAAQYQNDRALNNSKPLTATELLGELEGDHQVVPSYLSSLDERRAILDARQKVTRGARRESVEDALRILLGADFIRYETTAESEIVTWPNGPDAVGTFQRAGAPKRGFILATPVSRIQEPSTVTVTQIAGLELPEAGGYCTVGPDSRDPSAERVLLAAVTPTSITATFQKPHPIGTVALAPHPVWISNQRYGRIVVTVAAASSPETRRKINEVMSRMLRGVSQWFVCHDQGTFILGHAQRGKLNSTVLG